MSSTDAVLQAYCNQYGDLPRTPNELISFSKTDNDLKTLSYTQAKNVIERTRQRMLKSDYPKYLIGDSVLLTKDRHGIIRYIGKVPEMGSGIWYGIELTSGTLGHHDGIIKGHRYFKTDGKRAMFMPPFKLRRKLTKKDRLRRQSYHDLKENVKLLQKQNTFNGDLNFDSNINSNKVTLLFENKNDLNKYSLNNNNNINNNINAIYAPVPASHSRHSSSEQYPNQYQHQHQQQNQYQHQIQSNNHNFYHESQQPNQAKKSKSLLNNPKNQKNQKNQKNNQKNQSHHRRKSSSNVSSLSADTNHSNNNYNNNNNNNNDEKYDYDFENENNNNNNYEEEEEDDDNDDDNGYDPTVKTFDTLLKYILRQRGSHREGLLDVYANPNTHNLIVDAFAQMKELKPKEQEILWPALLKRWMKYAQKI